MAGERTLRVKIVGESKSAEDSMDRVKDKSVSLEDASKHAAAGFALAGAAVLGAGAALYQVGSTFDDLSDTIRVATGATGDALAGLEDSAKNVAASVPASFEDVGTAISEVNQRLGLTGKPLEDVTSQLLNLSNITGTDLATNVDNMTRAFGDWGVSTQDQSKFMDELFRASQATGTSVDTLSQQIVAYGAPMRSLGFSMEETSALLGTFNKTGVNTELVMGSMRKALAKFAGEGKDAHQALNETIDAIKNAGSASEATGIAMDVFGSKAGADMADTIRGGKFEIQSMVDTIKNGKDTINGAASDTADFAEQWQMFKNNVLIALEPLAAKVFGAMGTAMGYLTGTVMPKLGAAFDKIKTSTKGFRDAIQPFVKFLGDNFQAVLGAVAAFIITLVVPGFYAWATAAWATAAANLAAMAPMILLGAAIAALVFVIILVVKHFDLIKDAAGAVAKFFTGKVIPWFKAFGKGVADVFNSVLGWVVDTFNSIKDWVEGALGDIGNFFKTAFDLYIGLWKWIFTTLLTIVTTVFGAVRDWISNAISAVVGFFTTFAATVAILWSGLWNGVLSLIQTIWNNIVGFIQGALNSIVTAIQALGGMIASAASGAFNFIVTAASNAINGAIGWVKNGISGIVSALSGWAGSIASAASSAWSGIKNGFSAAVNWVISKWNGIQFKIPEISFMGMHVGGTTIGVPKIPLMATGGTIAQPGMAIVGEAGPELIDMPRGAQVTPLTPQAASAASGRLGGGPQITINTHTNASPSDIANEFIWLMKTGQV